MNEASPADFQKQQDRRFVDRAYRLIVRLARTQHTIHVEDIWDYAEAHHWRLPSNHKIVGQAFSRAARDGILRSSDVAIKVTRHGGHYYRPIWISRKYAKQVAA